LPPPRLEAPQRDELGVRLARAAVVLDDGEGADEAAMAAAAVTTKRSVVGCLSWSLV
jgi:hypothetical protein